VAAAAQALFETIGVRPAAIGRRQSVLDQGRKQLGHESAESAAERGRAMSPRQAAALAMAMMPAVPASPPGGVNGHDPAGAAAGAGTGAADGAAASGPGEGPDKGTGPGSAQPGPVPPGSAWPGPLTERECEVAKLIAEGLSNRAIGNKLFISQSTAARHVANIFTKLGVNTRAQVTSWVVKAGADPPELASPQARRQS
jgi:DNA-binding CsgD family transcriptional regulator